MRTIWQRQKDEPNLWYERFHRYYLLVPATRRTIDAAWRAAEVEAGHDRPAHKTAPGSWYRKAREWQWVERSEAYDSTQRVTLQIAYEQERLDDRRRRLDVMRAVRTRLVQALRELDPTDATWTTVVHGTVAVNSELRREYNDEPDGRIIGQTTPSGRTTAADLDNLTDDQLAAIEAAARIMESQNAE